jgi:hypothetical protein
MKQRNKNAKMQTHDRVEQTAEPTPELIRSRARKIFAARGGAPGHEINDWLQAEIELKSRTGLQKDSAG